MLYEKLPLECRPPLAEIPYGFKNLWRIRVSQYDLNTLTFRYVDIIDVVLNGVQVTVDQLVQLYDYSRDLASLSQPGSNGLLITIDRYAEYIQTFVFSVMAEQSLDVTGILSVTGDMVDNSNPQRPVINHDPAKLDATVYAQDKSALDQRLTADETAIGNLTTDVNGLKTTSLTGVSVNGAISPVVANVAQVTIDAISSADFQAAIDLKVDKSIGTVIQTTTSSFDQPTKTLNLGQTTINLGTGNTNTTSTPYNLETLLGLDVLEGKDIPTAYFFDATDIPYLGDPYDVALSGVYRFAADGSKIQPTATDNIEIIYALSTEYSDYNVPERQYIMAIGTVLSYTTAYLTTSFSRVDRVQIYNKFNEIRAGTMVFDKDHIALFIAIQDVPRPASAGDVIPTTNDQYFRAVVNYSPQPPATMRGNFETQTGPGQAYPTDRVRLELLRLGSGYTDFVEFKTNAIPSQITDDTTWDANISLWVTDGYQFTSRSALLAYLGNFTVTERFKLSNLGIIRTEYQAGGITITPEFTADEIGAAFATVFQPIPTGTNTGKLSEYNASNILVPSASGLSDLATSAQGAKADTAVQAVALASGASNGTVTLTVDSTTTNVAVTGLDTAAYSPASAFATSAQGAKADSALQTASLQPGGANGSLNLVTNGSVSPDVIPTGIKTAAFSDATAFATAAQGAKADSAVQTISISSGSNPGTIQYIVNGGAPTQASVAGLGSAAYTDTTNYATALQGTTADTALQPSDVVDNTTSTATQLPLSANQGRLLEQQIASLGSSGRPIGGFPTYADRYTNTSQYATDLQPIAVNDQIYIAADENHTDQPAQYRVASISGTGAITYSFLRLVPPNARDFITSPIQPDELANGAVNTNHIQNGAIITADIANNAVTGDKLSVDVQNVLTHASNSILGPITTTGMGPIVTDVRLGASGALETTKTTVANVMAVVNSGNGSFITGGTITGDTLTLTKDGTAVQTLNITGTGNFISGMNVSGSVLNATRSQAITTIQTLGNGNVVTDISNTGTATKGTAVTSTVKSGTGNVLTGVSMDLTGVATFTSTNAVTSLTKTGSGNFISDVSMTGGVLTATRAQAITSLPDSSTTQKGIVQLEDSTNSTSTSLALTANQGNVLNSRISTLDSENVKLTGKQTIYDVKIIANHLQVPAKSTMPVDPNPAEYATETQVATRIPRPDNALQNTIAIFDANRNVISGGILYQDIASVPITDAEIDNAFDAVFGA